MSNGCVEYVTLAKFDLILLDDRSFVVLMQPLNKLEIFLINFSRLTIDVIFSIKTLTFSIMSVLS